MTIEIVDFPIEMRKKTCFVCFPSGAAAVFDVCRPNQVQSARWDQFIVLWWQFKEMSYRIVKKREICFPIFGRTFQVSEIL